MSKIKPVISLMLLALLWSFPMLAQQQPPAFSGNYYINQAGQGLFVNTPGSIARSLSYSFAGSSVPSWGGLLVYPYVNIPLVKPADSSGCSSMTAMNGKFAFVYRGGCEFGAKAYNAQLAGAWGIIVVNNVPGLTTMGPGIMGSMVSIPVIMITKEDGDAINAALNSSQNVTITFTPWETGVANDAAIVKGGVAQWHANIIPKTLLTSAIPYKGITAAYVANYGSSTLTNVKLKSVVNFTPAGGSATQVFTDSATVLSFAPADSIKALISPNSYDVTPPGTGRYDVIYTASSTQADNNTANNTMTTSFYISDSIYSKGRYDVVNMKPLCNQFYKYASLTPMITGQLLFMGKGRHMAKRVQFTVSNGQTGVDLSGNSPVNAYLFKWTDGLVTADSLIQASELELQGTGTKYFSTTDTNSMTFDIELSDALANPDHYPVMDSGWYWVALEVEPDLMLGIDGETDKGYYVRSYARDNQPDSYKEFYTPSFQGNLIDLVSSSGNQPVMFPYEGSSNVNTASFTNQKKNYIPAIALHVLPVLDVADSTVVNCIGDSTGQIIITPQSGTPPYQYKLGNGNFQASNIFTKLVAGTYTVTVLDAGNELAYVDVNVGSVFRPNANAGVPTAITEGQSVTIGGSPSAAGNAPFTYAWTPAAGLNDPSISNPVASPAISTQYMLIVTDVNHCTDTSYATVVVFPLGADNVAGRAELLVYPNPAQDVFTISGREMENGVYDLELTDVTGHRVSWQQYEVTDHTISRQIPLATYADGIYLLTVEHGKNKAVIKIQKWGNR